MITKFKTIKNLAVFQNFDWDSSMRDEGNNVITFNQLNIFYGRNYSGKTTLSRIIRALELGQISDKYENPEFTVSFKETGDSSNLNLNGHNKKIRVFNEDFVRANLRFINNSDESIIPFAILGGNNALEEQIQELKDQLGSNEESKETGYYLDLKNTTLNYSSAKRNYQSALTKLDDQLSDKATNRQRGIKYKPEKFGDQNYTKPKLETDIKLVLHNGFKAITDSEQTQLVQLLNEKTNTTIPPISPISINFKDFVVRTETLVTKKIGDSDKIEQLVKDSVLNRWVKEGRTLHKKQLTNCAFCGNPISNERWSELDKHFDVESEELERNIDKLIQEIENEIKSTSFSFSITKNNFYSKFHTRIERLIELHKNVNTLYISNLNDLKAQLIARKNDLINQKIFTPVKDYTVRINWTYGIYENFRQAANAYSSTLVSDQSEAKKQLRLREVYDFITTIQYENEVKIIEGLKTILDKTTQKKSEISLKIKEQIDLIKDKERLMKDEEKGALKVNEYLNNFFGHDFLTLQAILDQTQLEDSKKIKFEIIRNGKKAHHLSEGECSLIAFCYFMAKLEDVDTKGSKPIIWIDDPISSLDGNHIFFLYSLINSEIVTNKNYEQLFISTHNLDFLKYLKRLPGALNKNESKYFLIVRENDISRIKLMPRYLKDYVTEFNYLFHQIYLCANSLLDDETQHHLYYNFANNTRKFLEAFLFYKYPNAIEHEDKLARFFGDNRQASAMTDRINNEYSHLVGLFERSMIPVDVPEMKKTAAFILKKIEEKDIDQYDALLKSIGVEVIA